MNFVPATVRRTLRTPRVRAAATVTGSARGTGHGTGLAALVTALILGILGMHALASHGTSATSSMASMASGMAADVADEADDSRAHGSRPVDVDTHNSPMFSHLAGEDSGHGEAMSMWMLCAVMLAAAAITLLVLLLARIVRPWLPASFHPAEVRARALQKVRGSRPPPAWEFSVIRC